MITWTCHICKRERRDSQISVHSRKLRHRETGVELQENIRYCNDSRDCVNRAPDHRLLSDDKYEEITSGTH